ncbi:MAG: tRNA (adenosine(37)-N6)-dimethylallyltransferase MiaA [Bacilli bacterium]|nr:tRNA (adenosine(37)-N6)-dimethylallyltransferase MiaA [Bacilli bacterium]MDY4051847.1 tRNA (adenosine(37)-N6)-dimethylallyltransferase MiaA [Bacilli bacterium]
MNKVIIIAGPTGVGKTKLSISIAKALHTKIINGDAFQVYKYMDILTAKIKEEEKSGITHYMFDILEPTEEFSVAEYQKQVRTLVDTLNDEGIIPIIVGGSGLYLDSVIYDYQFPETSSRERDSMYDEYSNEELHEMLEKLNPAAAQKIHMNNRKRVIRAIELSKTTGTINSFNNKLVYDALVFFLEDERESLYEIINKRVDEMVANGLLEEVKFLNDHFALSKTAKGAIGLKELLPYLNNETSLDEAIDNIKKNTRHFAKRQFTWYRNKDNVIHIKINRHNFDETVNQVLDIIKNKWK